MRRVRRLCWWMMDDGGGGGCVATGQTYTVNNNSEFLTQGCVFYSNFSESIGVNDYNLGS